VNPFVVAVERILLTTWVVGLWITGYLVVPSLFAGLDSRRLAGELAGDLFTRLGWIGMVCGVLLLVLLWVRCGRGSAREWRAWVLVAMLAIVGVGLFVLQPQMQALKAQGIVAGGVQAVEFGRLHGISSAFYLVNSVLGLLLVAAGTRPPR